MTPPFSTERIKEILDLALERPTQDREAFISGMCGDDTGMLGEVLSLLRSLEAVGTILEPKPVGDAPAPPAEPLTGLRFGAYRVTERIGAGGMGIVYKAEDSRLGRTVAVKALPAHLAADPHRRARFEHEARVLASLNHPNIEAIHGVEDTARGPVLVLEYVPGQPLSQRVASGPLPLDDALPIARLVLRALEGAHAAGVVHRDLKPANIHVLPDGTVKVLDFGIAKVDAPPLVGPSPSTPDRSPAMAATIPGAVLGTVSYMSPEQARGKPVDRRTDLWAFGCMLFEMLTGRRAFEGETTSDTLAAILRAEPDWSRLPADAPAHVRRLLKRCLEKDPDLRLRDAGDARLELEPGSDGGDAPPPRPAPRWPAFALAGTGVLALVAIVAYPGSRHAPPGHGPDRLVRFTVDLGPEAAFSGWGAVSMLAVSPNGADLVYSGGREDQRRLFKRSLRTLETVELPGTQEATAPFFSPDSAWIAFCRNGQVRKIPVTGGGSEAMVESGVYGNGAAWAADGSIAFIGPEGSLWVRPLGGAARVAVPADPHWGFAHPEFVPGQDAILFTVCEHLSERFHGRIDAVRLGTGQRTTVYDAACCPRLVPGTAGDGAPAANPDRLLFWQAGSLLAAPFDPSSLRVTGAAQPVLALAQSAESIPAVRFAVSRTGGVLASLPGNITYDVTRLAWFDPAGAAPSIIAAAAAFDTPRISPDGTKIAYIDSSGGMGDLWVYDVARASSARLTTTRKASQPVWTMPDGRRIVFSAGTTISAVSSATGTDAEVLWTAPSESQGVYPGSLTPDGTTILVTMAVGDDGHDLFALDLPGAGPLRPLFPDHRKNDERIWPRLSPDGALLAYTSLETGRFEVYLNRYADMSGRTMVSAGGGYRPTWSPDGRRLYYQYVDRIFAVDIESADPPRVSLPKVVLANAPTLRFDVGRDGRILMPHPSGEWRLQDKIDVTIGWQALLDH